MMAQNSHYDAALLTYEIQLERKNCNLYIEYCFEVCQKRAIYFFIM